MEGFEKRIDANIAKRRENDTIQLEDTKQVMFRIGSMTLFVSLMISICAFLFGSTEVCSIFGFFATFELFIIILTSC